MGINWFTTALAASGLAALGVQTVGEATPGPGETYRTAQIVMPTSYDGAPPAIEDMSIDEQLTIKLLEEAFPNSPFNLLPVLRAVKAYLSEQAACIIGTDVPILEGEVSSNPIFQATFRRYRLKGTSGPVKLLGNLTGGDSFADKTAKDVTVVSGISNDDLLEKLRRGRVDAIVLGPRAQERGFVEKHGIELIPGFVTKLNVRLKCRPTPEGQQMATAMNKTIARYVASRKQNLQ